MDQPGNLRSLTEQSEWNAWSTHDQQYLFLQLSDRWRFRRRRQRRRFQLVREPNLSHWIFDLRRASVERWNRKFRQQPKSDDLSPHRCGRFRRRFRRKRLLRPFPAERHAERTWRNLRFLRLAERRSGRGVNADTQLVIQREQRQGCTR